MATTVSAHRLQAFATTLLAAAGVPAAAAAACARVLVAADLDGHGSHGVLRLPTYLAAIARGQIAPRARPEIVATGPATAWVDGGQALGPVVALAAMEEAIRLARAAGAGVVAARRSNHFGAAGYYAEQAAAAGYVGLALSNTPPALPPPGGAAPYLGTNPLAFAFPTSGEPLVIDLSLSVVARGKILEARQAGAPIPSGWAVDRAGHPTTDPAAALAGALLPLGGPKGFALALAVEALTGVLAGAASGPHVAQILDDTAAPANVGHLFMALDPDRFGEPGAFRRRLDALLAELRAVPPAEGGAGVRLPGERRAAARRRALAEGIALPAATVAALNSWAARLGLADRLPAEPVSSQEEHAL
ncbi:MAG TPA: Ldh family oxidoreductase [Chloroflexota bacterium]|nr:Ldh family oxidoreductase [Chloroflexota bacterium]